MEVSKKIQEQIAGDMAIQNQTIGDNTQTTNIGSQINVSYNGLPATDVVTLTSVVSIQVTQQALSLCTQVAGDIALQRMNDFAKVWVPRIEKMEGAVESLQTPKFQFLIRDANISAAQSSRKEDLAMLSELLACHIEKGQDRKTDAGIKRAIEIVHEVDNDALCALTIYMTLKKIAPKSGEIRIGLQVLDDLFANLLYLELPKDAEWIEHLEVLGAIRTMPKGMRFSNSMPFNYNGYICVGIQEGSENYNQALEILDKIRFSHKVLVPNECLPGFVKLPIAQFEDLKDELKPICNLYNKDKMLLDQVKRNYMETCDSFPNLQKVKSWYNSLQISFEVNSIGRALAQTNAKRCYPTFPDLI